MTNEIYAESTRVPTKYEIPQKVVAEAIVNAVVHRDYTSNASVQVMLFRDRLEVWNPGTLPPPLTIEDLRGPHASIPQVFATLTKHERTMTDLVQQVYANRSHRFRTIEEAEAVFRRNNGICGMLPPEERVVILNPYPLSETAISQWHRKKPYLDVRFRSNPDLFGFLSTTETYLSVKKY